mmetsp:Transcript_13176/g.20681  ORF Transcript_13176/g.20681 Transcript_13176/m.20681 type:complete len:203 (-) Transcript_13176:884-1492(-)
MTRVTALLLLALGEGFGLGFGKTAPSMSTGKATERSAGLSGLGTVVTEVSSFLGSWGAGDDPLSPFPVFSLVRPLGDTSATTGDKLLLCLLNSTELILALLCTSGTFGSAAETLVLVASAALLERALLLQLPFFSSPCLSWFPFSATPMLPDLLVTDSALTAQTAPCASGLCLSPEILGSSPLRIPFTSDSRDMIRCKISSN